MKKILLLILTSCSISMGYGFAEHDISDEDINDLRRIFLSYDVQEMCKVISESYFKDADMEKALRDGRKWWKNRDRKSS